MSFKCHLCGMVSPGVRCEAPWCGGREKNPQQFYCSVCHCYSAGSECANPACTLSGKLLTYFADVGARFIEDWDVIAFALVKDVRSTWLLWSTNSAKPDPGIPSKILGEMGSRSPSSPRVDYAKKAWAQYGMKSLKGTIIGCIKKGLVRLVKQPDSWKCLHAEVCLTNYILACGNKVAPVDGHKVFELGISKKPCILCHLTLNLVPSVTCPRRPHLMIYKRWYIPPFVNGLRCFADQANRNKALVAYFNKNIEHYTLRLRDATMIVGEKKTSFEMQVQYNESDDEGSNVH